MIRLDLSYFLRLSANLTRLRYIRSNEPISEVRTPLFDARAWLVNLAQNDLFGLSSMRNTKAAIPLVVNRIDQILSRDENEILTSFDLLDLLNDLNSFEVLLVSDFSIADAYYVTEKEPYSTIALVTKGESLFPPSLRNKVPEALVDMQQAAKCLAFEVPTAAAFHVHRATETVLRQYWKEVTGNAPKPRTRSIGVYLAALKKMGFGDEKVIAALSQMNELHRNPTIHPEAVLDVEEAIALIGIANSVVAAMLKQIPDLDPEQPDLLTP